MMPEPFWKERLAWAALIFEAKENELVWTATHSGYGIDPDTNKIWKVRNDGVLSYYAHETDMWVEVDSMNDSFPQYLHPMTGWKMHKLLEYRSQHV